MNKTFKTLKAILSMALAGVAFAPAVDAMTVKELYNLPVEQRWSVLENSVNKITDRLQDRYDARGQLKPRDLYLKQKDFGLFIVKLFDEKDETELRVSYAKLNSLIYSASLDDKHNGLTIERIILTFALERYQERQAADAAKNQAPSPAQ